MPEVQLDKWVDKYRPTSVDDMILTDELREFFKSMVTSGKFTNMSLIASPGIGKTTLAKALAHSARAETLFLGCAGGDGRVEAIQTKLIPFTQSMPFDDRPMFVILDEIDSASATSDSSFQKALRNVIEAAPNVVFICTANYGTKVIPAVLSRCPAINLQYTPRDVLVRLKAILDAEGIEYTKDDLREFVNFTVKKFYPDIRSIVNYLQSSCSSGKLVVSKTAMADAERDSFLKELCERCVASTTSANILDLRQFYLDSKDKIDDYRTVGAQLIDYAVDNGFLHDKATILRVANIYYQMNVVVDPEIQFFAMLVSMASQPKQG